MDTDPTFKAAPIYILKEAGGTQSIWIPTLLRAKPVLTEKHSHSLLWLPGVFVFSCLFQGDQTVNKT